MYVRELLDSWQVREPKLDNGQNKARVLIGPEDFVIKAAQMHE